MIPNKDIYADKHGKITENPEEYAIQVAVAGVHLDDRVMKRYGITDSLVSTEEPGAVRPVRGKAEIVEKEEAKAEEPVDEPAEVPNVEAEAEEAPASPAEEKPKTEATKKPAAKGAKKNK